MLRSLYSGVSGLTSHQTKMDVIGNNIANVNTYGFKGSTVAFSDIYYQTTKAATAGSNTQGGVNPSQIGYGTQIAAITKNMSRSSFQSSSSALDVAIAGEGFLQVQDKAGNIYYTRAGKLTVDSEGNLVDLNGKFVLGTMNSDPTNANGLSETPGSSKIAINVPAITTGPQSFSNLTSFTVSENGTLIGIHPEHGTLTFGRIDLATFDNTNGLEEAGNTYFAATANSGKAKVAVPGFSGSGSLVGSALEMSNVNLAQEFTDMITAQRGFQANARIITTSDSMLEELVNLKR